MTRPGPKPALEPITVTRTTSFVSGRWSANDSIDTFRIKDRHANSSGFDAPFGGEGRDQRDGSLGAGAQGGVAVSDPIDLRLGDCLDVLKTLPDNSVDSVVTDPPYGLSFMGKRWDYDVPAVEVWAECLRVLKPGGHLLAFAGTRTQHRMAVRIEDAGFEIRDMIAWVYSTGFPKSLNLDHERGKTTCGCDGGTLPYAHGHKKPEHGLFPLSDTDVPAPKRDGEGEREVLQPFLQEQSLPVAGRTELPSTEVRGRQPSVEGWGDPSPQEGELRSGQVRQGSDVGAIDGASGRVCDAPSAGDGGVVRVLADADGVRPPRRPQPAEQHEGKPSTVAGQSFPQNVGAWKTCGGCGLPCVPKGLGTALKPALEPITVARKPLAGTVAACVTTWGTGALNVDGCRVGAEVIRTQGGDKFPGVYGTYATCPESTHQGRFPANLIHDGSDEVVSLFPQARGQQGAVTGAEPSSKTANADGDFAGRAPSQPRGDSGSAARFFYCAKASKADRGADNKHPTVKPTDLMCYLCRLVTPPGGVVLDPFMGSGSTGKAAIREGFRFIGIERDPEYMTIARARIVRGVQPSMM